MKHILDKLQSALWIYDSDLKVVLSNKKSQQLNQDILVLDCQDIESRSKEKQKLADILKKIRDLTGESRPKKKKFLATYHSQGKRVQLKLLLSVLDDPKEMFLFEGKTSEAKPTEAKPVGPPAVTEESLWKAVEPLVLSITSNAILIYSLDTGRVVTSNENAKNRLPKEVFDSGTTNILPHVKPEQVADLLDKVRTDGRGQLLAQTSENGKTIFRNIFGKKFQLSPTSQQFLLVVEENATEQEVTQKVIEEKNTLTRELTKARATAEDAVRRKRQFLATMSHEIRTPLTGIIGMATLLAESPLSKDQKQNIDVIQNSCELLLSILTDIMDLSKIEAGKVQIENAEFDIFKVVEDCVEFASPQAFAKNLEIFSEVGLDIPNKLLGDPGRIKQVLLNFISNAVKFTEKGEIGVRVILEKETDTWVDARFEVTDTGKGMDENTLNSVLNSKTGRGIHISRQLVQFMGGKIGATSTFNEGTTFHFRLKLEKAFSFGTHSLYKKCPTPLLGSKAVVVSSGSKHSAILQTCLKFWGIAYELFDDAKQALAHILKIGGDESPYKFLFLNSQFDEAAAIAEKLAPLKVEVGSFIKGRFITDEVPNLCVLTIPLKPSKLFGFFQKIAASVNTLANSDAHEKTTETARINILVAEDNQMNQVVVKKILERTPHLFTFVSNGMEAIDAFKRENFDLVLMDCQMPLLDGYLTTQKIRELEQTQGGHIVIVAMTANVLQEDREKCFQSGMDDFLSKPILMADMLAKLNQWATHIQINKDEMKFGGFQTSFSFPTRKTLVSESPDILSLLPAKSTDANNNNKNEFWPVEFIPSSEMTENIQTIHKEFYSAAQFQSTQNLVRRKSNEDVFQN